MHKNSSPDQRTRLGHHLETAYPTLIRMLGEDFHSVVLRMAVHIERIALILSLLPDEFGHAILVKEAATQGISARTAERWNEAWQQSGIVYRLKYDCYKKIA